LWGRHGRRRARSVGTRFRSTGRCDAHQSGWRAPEHSSFRAQAPQMPVSLQRARLPHCRSLTRTACLRPVPPSVSADLRSALIQGGGRKRYARALAGCHDLGFELGAIAPASTPAKRHFYFDGVHMSTCFDKRMRYSQDVQCNSRRDARALIFWEFSTHIRSTSKSQAAKQRCRFPQVGRGLLAADGNGTERCQPMTDVPANRRAG